MSKETNGNSENKEKLKALQLTLDKIPLTVGVIRTLNRLADAQGAHSLLQPETIAVFFTRLTLIDPIREHSLAQIINSLEVDPVCDHQITPGE